MTTTHVYQGMNLDKPTSKVLAPPGGKSNISFGGYEAAPAEPKQKQQPTQPSPFAQQDCGPAQKIIPKSSSAGFNLLTGEPEQPANQSNQQRGGAQARMDPINMSAAGGRVGDKQVTRKNPPGGFSSFSFGGD